MRPLILALVILVRASAAYTDVTSIPRVIDGDTIEIANQRVRLHGIDAPEAKQTCADKDGKEWPCGQEAFFALANLIGDHWNTYKGNERDRYRRLIAVFYAGEYGLNTKMVRQRWVLAYRQYSMDYVDAKDASKETGIGMWQWGAHATVGIAKSRPMTPNLNIYRDDEELINQRGLKGASNHAANRIADLSERGDQEGLDAWRKIREALLDLNDVRFKDDAVI